MGAVTTQLNRLVLGYDDLGKHSLGRSFSRRPVFSWLCEWMSRDGLVSQPVSDSPTTVLPFAVWSQPRGIFQC